MNKRVYIFTTLQDHPLPSDTHLEVREGEDMVCGMSDPNWTVWLVVNRDKHQKATKLTGSWGHSYNPFEVIEDAMPRLKEVGLNLVTHTSWILRSW